MAAAKKLQRYTLRILLDSAVLSVLLCMTPYIQGYQTASFGPGEVNSAGIFFSKVSPGIFVIKVKGNTYYFRKAKAAVLGAMKAQLPFSEGKCQLLNSWNKSPFPTIFYH